jgi:hypothetical protein
MTGEMETVEQATPSISIDNNGLITANTVQDTGYIEGSTKTATKQLDVKGATSVTPTKSAQTVVEANVYTTGDIVVNPIPSEYITTADATASADEIMSGETAYVNGSKVTGTFTIDNELSAQDDLISQIQTALQNKTATSGGITLPTLSNPATSEKLEDGYELIDENGNIVVGTHVCKSAGSNSMEFSVINNLPDIIFIYGVPCYPGDTTFIAVSDLAAESMVAPIVIALGFMDGEIRDYYNSYNISASFPIEGENGEPLNEVFDVTMYPQIDYHPFAVGLIEAFYEDTCYTFYCEEV